MNVEQHDATPGDPSPGPRGLRRGRPKRVLLVALTLALGTLLGLGSWSLQRDDPWWSTILANATVAGLLIIPGEYLLSKMRAGFESIERTTDEVRATAVSALEAAARAEESLEGVRESILQRQRQEFESERDVYRGLVRDSSRGSILRALRSATETEMITAQGVRSPIWETDLHYRYVVDGPEHELEVCIEADNGDILSRHPWLVDTPPGDFYQRLVEGVRRAGSDLGVGLNDPTQSIEELSNMLVEVAGHRSQELLGYRKSLQRIIERHLGWYFTETAVFPEDQLHYVIDVSRLDEMDWETHLNGKGWYSAGPALAFARRLYGVGTTA